VRRIVVGIVDYHSGNIRSVSNAIDFAGGEVRQVIKPADVDGCTHLILPGVGAFGFCAAKLRASGLLPTVEEWALKDQKPLLGICVGMQLMADFSEEQGLHQGLGWIGGTVRKLESAQALVRIPHVGWNNVVFNEPFGEFSSGDTPDFYFDHSYAYDAPSGNVVATCSHGRRFSAVVRKNSIIAAQFHPEKSQTAGMQLLKSFFTM
jgi:glutamine amidotransferase